MAISLSYPDGSYSSSNKPSNETLINDLNIIETAVNATDVKFLVEHNSDGTHTTDVLSAVYPVGSIYINASVNTNPFTLLGFGTWEAFGTGRVIVGLDAGQTEFDTLGETGGAKTHTLTTDEIPSHDHSVTIYNTPAGSGGGIQRNGTNDGAGTVSTSSTGGGQAHNNLQPYIVAYMWKRVA